MNIDINQIINDMSSNGKVFQSEAQFQFDMAWQIKLKYPQYDVCLEMTTCYKRNNKKTKRFYTDIVVLDEDGNFCAIELKYKTRNIYFEDLDIQLLNHGATDLGRFDFLYDIFRIEKLKYKDDVTYNYNKRLKKFVKGYAILLTNESNYWNIKREGNNALYKDFCISNDDYIITNKPLVWNKIKENSCVDKTFRDVELIFKQDYKFCWREYCHNFRYLIQEI